VCTFWLITLRTTIRVIIRRGEVTIFVVLPVDLDRVWFTEPTYDLTADIHGVRSWLITIGAGLVIYHMMAGVDLVYAH
jgi:hypothetical protein